MVQKFNQNYDKKLNYKIITIIFGNFGKLVITKLNILFR